MYSDNSSILREKLILQNRVLTSNGYGEEVETWEDGPTLRCKYEPLRGAEYFRSAGLPERSAQIDGRIVIRFRRGLNPANHRVVYGGIVHDIKAVLPIRNRNQIHLMVVAKSTAQADGGTVNA